jgi:hypothetical protein
MSAFASFSRPLALGLAAAIGLAALPALAQTQTLGQRLDSGQITPAAFEQLVAGSGLTVDEARQLTVNEVAAEKWLDD